MLRDDSKEKKQNNCGLSRGSVFLPVFFFLLVELSRIRTLFLNAISYQLQEDRWKIFSSISFSSLQMIKEKR